LLRACRTLRIISFSHSARVNLVGCCVCYSVQEPSKATTYYISNFLFTFHVTPGSKRQHPPTRSAAIVSLFQCTPPIKRQLIFDCCVPRSNGGHLRPGQGSTHHSSFLSLHLTLQAMGDHHPHTLCASCISSPSYLLSRSILLVGCYVYLSIGGRLRPRHPPPPSLLTLHFNTPQMSKEATTAVEARYSMNGRFDIGNRDIH
jgi:hypothetical protein